MEIESYTEITIHSYDIRPFITVKVSTHDHSVTPEDLIRKAIAALQKELTEKD